jgi:hypothetical protein
MSNVNIEEVMNRLDEYLDTTSYCLLSSVESEDYESSIKYRDDMDKKIKSIFRLIMKNKLTTLKGDDLLETLYMLKFFYLKEWCDIMEIDSDRRPV